MMWQAGRLARQGMMWQAGRLAGQGKLWQVRVDPKRLWGRDADGLKDALGSGVWGCSVGGVVICC
jgi:hypothetical protein